MKAPPFRVGLSPSLGLHRTQQLARRIESALAPHFDRAVEVQVAGSYEHLEALLLGGGLELAWVNPLVIAHAQAAGATAVLQGVRHGRATFRSALVARREAKLRLEALVGARAAWTDPHSLGGYRMPLHHLRSHGLLPERLFASERFTFSYPAALGKVIEGKADVAPCFVHTDDPAALADVLRMIVGGGADELEPLGFTEEIPNDGLVIAPALGEERIAKLRLELQRILGSESGRQLLAALYVERLVPADTEAYGRLLELEKRGPLDALTDRSRAGALRWAR